MINIEKDTSLFSEQKLDGSPNITVLFFYEIREPCDFEGNHPEIDLSDWDYYYWDYSIIIIVPNLTSQFYLQQHKCSQDRPSPLCTQDNREFKI